jgi:hypothetical protein
MFVSPRVTGSLRVFGRSDGAPARLFEHGERGGVHQVRRSVSGSGT